MFSSVSSWITNIPFLAQVGRHCWVGMTMFRVGQKYIYTVYIRYVWQGNHQIYGHIRCIHTVLANRNYVVANS